jgi:hypothetical protein
VLSGNGWAGKALGKKRIGRTLHIGTPLGRCAGEIEPSKALELATWLAI